VAAVVALQVAVACAQAVQVCVCTPERLQRVAALQEVAPQGVQAMVDVLKAVGSAAADSACIPVSARGMSGVHTLTFAMLGTGSRSDVERLHFDPDTVSSPHATATQFPGDVQVHPVMFEAEGAAGVPDAEMVLVQRRFLQKLEEPGPQQAHAQLWSGTVRQHYLLPPVPVWWVGAGAPAMGVQRVVVHMLRRECMGPVRSVQVLCGWTMRSCVGKSVGFLVDHVLASAPLRAWTREQPQCAGGGSPLEILHWDVIDDAPAVQATHANKGGGVPPAAAAAVGLHTWSAMPSSAATTVHGGLDMVGRGQLSPCVRQLYLSCTDALLLCDVHWCPAKPWYQLW
jgi:hypothetical protein